MLTLFILRHRRGGVPKPVALFHRLGAIAHLESAACQNFTHRGPRLNLHQLHPTDGLGLAAQKLSGDRIFHLLDHAKYRKNHAGTESMFSPFIENQL